MLNKLHQKYFFRHLLAIACAISSINCVGEGALSGEAEQEKSKNQIPAPNLAATSSQSERVHKQTQEENTDKVKKAEADEDESDTSNDQYRNSSAGTESNVDQNNSKTQKTDRTTLLNEWCRGAGETKLVNSQTGIKSVFSELCTGNTATELFRTKLIDSAYDGKSEIAFVNITPASSQSSRRGAEVNQGEELPIDNLRKGGGGGVGGALVGQRLAYALKLPLKPEDVFNRYQAGLDEQGIRASIETSGGKAAVKILNQFQNDGLHHVRGVEFQESVDYGGTSRNAAKMEANARCDSYKLPGSDLFMYTDTLTKAIKILGKDDSIGAIIAIDGSTYIVAVHDLRVSSGGNDNASKLIESEAYAIWRGITSRAP